MRHDPLHSKISINSPKDEQLEMFSHARLGIASGLPTHTEVKSVLARLAGRLELVAESNRTSNEPWRISCAAGSPENYTQETHELFLSEFKSEVHELALRLNRLKLRFATVVLQGSHYTKEDSNRRNDHPLEPLSAIALECIHGGIKSEAERAELVRLFNRAVPERFRISNNPFISSYDAELIYRAISSMRYSPNPSSQQEVKIAEVLLERVSRMGCQLKDIEHSPLLLNLAEAKNDHQELLRSLKSEYREMIKQIATLQEYGNWCSPGYGESLKPQRGRGQSSVPFKTDYQRWATPLIQDVDRMAHTTFLGKQGMMTMLPHSFFQAV